MVMRQSTLEYGEKANKSAKGPVNIRGNIVEAMTKNLQEPGTLRYPRTQKEYDTVDRWYSTPWWHVPSAAAAVAYLPSTHLL